MFEQLRCQRGFVVSAVQNPYPAALAGHGPPPGHASANLEGAVWIQCGGHKERPSRGSPGRRPLPPHAARGRALSLTRWEWLCGQHAGVATLSCELAIKASHTRSTSRRCVAGDQDSHMQARPSCTTTHLRPNYAARTHIRPKYTRTTPQGSGALFLQAALDTTTTPETPKYPQGRSTNAPSSSRACKANLRATGRRLRTPCYVAHGPRPKTSFLPEAGATARD